MQGFDRPPRRTFIVHGEPQAADGLRVAIQDALGWATRIPRLDEEGQLD
jgi:metallo-beta-lactamase family protein